MKLKMIYGSASDSLGIENQFNTFMSENIDIDVVEIRQALDQYNFVITIYYNEISKDVELVADMTKLKEKENEKQGT